MGLTMIIVQQLKNFLEPLEQKLRRKMHKNRPQLLVAGPVVLHDNARPHIADYVTKKLRDYGWEVIPHAPYSLDIYSTRHRLLPKVKRTMLGGCFTSLEETVPEIFDT